MKEADIKSINSDYESIITSTGATGDNATAANLLKQANEVVDAVLRAGSSGEAQTKSSDSARSAGNEAGNIKALADELGEKAQEARDKVLDKLEEARDKVNEKLDDKISDLKESDPEEIFQAIGNGATYETDAGSAASTYIKQAKEYLTAIRKSEERDSLLSPALKTALDRLERNAISKNGAGMDLDTREAITRSVSTAQQIITKAGSLATYKAKLLNIDFKNLSTIKSMCQTV